ncbi:MAG: M28 family peptidase [Bacteroidales bacterium]|nr:M28 family peptidase [Bacteroidales bacterium]
MTYSFLLIALGGTISAQNQARKMIPSGRNAERIVSAEALERQVEFLTDTLIRGRETGTPGANEAAFWIARQLELAGLMPMGSTWGHSFPFGKASGHNILGFLPGKRQGAKEMYVIVSAHYDSHGIIEGTLYPGADSNASGVVAMVNLARMFSKMKELGRSYGKNIIFAGLDAREKNSLGAEALWSEIEEGRLKDPLSGETITPSKVYSTVVLDILGSTLSPLQRGRKDYLIMLSNGQFTYDLKRANENPGLGLDLGFDYYGSPNFTEMFHSKVGDQKVFTKEGTMCVVFTSGITMKTNKVEDDYLSLNYEIFKRRIFLIFHWLTKIL